LDRQSSAVSLNDAKLSIDYVIAGPVSVQLNDTKSVAPGFDVQYGFCDWRA
jgi:hypothetical protein